MVSNRCKQELALFSVGEGAKSLKFYAMEVWAIMPLGLPTRSQFWCLKFLCHQSPLTIFAVQGVGMSPQDYVWNISINISGDIYFNLSPKDDLENRGLRGCGTKQNGGSKVAIVNCVVYRKTIHYCCTVQLIRLKEKKGVQM